MPAKATDLEHSKVGHSVGLFFPITDAPSESRVKELDAIRGSKGGVLECADDYLEELQL